MARRVAVFTSSRAEYGLLRPLLAEIKRRDSISLQLIVSGTHLSVSHGMTRREIEADGYAIDSAIDMLISGDDAFAASKSAALALVGVAEALDKLKPDIFVLLGDRYELLAAAQAAVLARVPIAHLHGGESTEGAIDELMRHAVTKLAHIHFPAAEPYAQRLRQMGESSEHIWTVGALAIDNISCLEPVPRAVLEQELGCTLKPPSCLVTYHPVTNSTDFGVRGVESLLQVLRERDGTVILTGTNADPGSGSIRRALTSFADEYPDRVVFAESLGSRRYLSLMSYIDVVIGNSSSGLLEAPAVGVPSVDIGSRQQGRLRAPSVINCDGSVDAIRSALALSLTPELRQLAKNRITPYGRPGVARRIADVLESVSLDSLEKPFVDYRSQPKYG